MTPEWRAVEGYKGLYEVSNDGRVRRVAGPDSRGHHRQQREMRSAVDGPGYRIVALCKNGKMRTLRVHRLVARAFIGPCPAGKEVNHKDGDHFNNSDGNLEYVTNAENQAHAVRIGLKARGERNGSAKLSESDIAAIRALRSSGVSRADVAQRFGIKHIDYVTRISSGKVWAYLLPE